MKKNHRCYGNDINSKNNVLVTIAGGAVCGRVLSLVAGVSGGLKEEFHSQRYYITNIYMFRKSSLVRLIGNLSRRLNSTRLNVLSYARHEIIPDIYGKITNF